MINSITSLTEIEKCFLEDFRQFDPEKKIDIQALFPYRFRATKYKMQLPDYALTSKELNDSEQLKNIISSILWGDPFDFINDKVYIPADYIKEKLNSAKNYVESIYKQESEIFQTAKLDHIEFIIFQVMGLRLYKEIIYQNLPFPLKKINKEESDQDFKNLKEYLQKLHNEIPNPMDNKPLWVRNRSGCLTSNMYMQKFRLSVNKGGKLSPLNDWQSPRIVPVLAFEIRNHNSRDISTALIRNQLVYRWGASQFIPSHVGWFINYFQKRFNFSIKSYLDLCAGWGDRLVGAFAAHTLGLDRYVATDPNLQLHQAYEQIVNNYKPEEFKVYLYQKPMEECSESELSPNGKKNEMMMTSPPYFDLEKYPGDQQSFRRYKDYTNWKECFLYKIIDQSVRALVVNGFIVIDMGNIKKYKIMDDLKEYVTKCIYLQNCDGFKDGTHFMLVTRFKGMFFDPEYPISPVQEKNEGKKRSYGENTSLFFNQNNDSNPKKLKWVEEIPSPDTHSFKGG